MENNTDTMTRTLTLELTPYEEETLLNALNTEACKWLNIKTDILLDRRPNASYEGADMLYKEAKGLSDKVSVHVSQLS
tara:strand:- start:385 stop:618 length:234 start_codon:yes stop_codon:yes gene_type:complete